MIRTSRRLADGREILYFDDDAHAAEHSAPDTRDLPPVSTRSQLRRVFLTPVVMATWAISCGSRAAIGPPNIAACIVGAAPTPRHRASRRHLA